MKEFIKSEKFAIIIVLLSIITQTYHSYYTFISVSKIQGILAYVQAVMFVVSFESFALFYLVRGKKNLSLFYSVCYLIMNIFYYWSNFTGLNLFIGLFLSTIMPFSIYKVSETFVENEHNTNNTESRKDNDEIVITSIPSKKGKIS